MGDEGVVGGVGRVGKVDHRLSNFGLGQQQDQRVGQESRLLRCGGFTGNGRSQI